MTTTLSVSGKRASNEPIGYPNKKKKLIKKTVVEQVFSTYEDVFRLITFNLSARTIYQLKTINFGFYQLVANYLKSDKWAKDHLELYEFPSPPWKKTDNGILFTQRKHYDTTHSKILEVWKKEENGDRNKLKEVPVKDYFPVLTTLKSHVDLPDYLVILENDNVSHITFYNQLAQEGHKFQSNGIIQNHGKNDPTRQVCITPDYYCFTFKHPQNNHYFQTNIISSSTITGNDEKPIHNITWDVTRLPEALLNEKSAWFFQKQYAGKTTLLKTKKEICMIFEKKGLQDGVQDIKKRYHFGLPSATEFEFVQQGNMGVWVGTSNQKIRIVFIDLKSLELLKEIEVDDLENESDPKKTLMVRYFELEFQLNKLIYKSKMFKKRSMTIDLLDYSVTVAD